MQCLRISVTTSFSAVLKLKACCVILTLQTFIIFQQSKCCCVNFRFYTFPQREKSKEIFFSPYHRAKTFRSIILKKHFIFSFQWILMIQTCQTKQKITDEKVSCFLLDQNFLGRLRKGYIKKFSLNDTHDPSQKIPRNDLLHGQKRQLGQNVFSLRKLLGLQVIVLLGCKL